MKASSRAVLAVLVLGTVTALAQPDTGKPGAAGAGSAAPAKAAAVPKTPAELSARADALTTQIEGDYREALRVRDIAKKQKDVIKLNCVNDRLVAIKAQMNLADAAKLQANASTADGTVTDDSKKAFQQLSSNAEGIRTLREEAAACVGGSDLMRQEAGLEVSVPDIVDDPGTIDPYGAGEVPAVEPPGYASAFR